MSRQILVAARTGLVHTTPAIPLGLTRLLPISRHFLFFSEPPYTAIASFNLSNTRTNSTKAPCMPHLNAGLAPALCWITHTCAIIHVHPLPQSACTVVLFIASLGGCHRYLSSLNLRLSYVEIRDYSSTTMMIPLPTKKITNGTNELANAPIDASMNLNICSTLNNSSQNARPSSKVQDIARRISIGVLECRGLDVSVPTRLQASISTSTQFRTACRAQANWNSIQSDDQKIKRRRMRSATFSEDRPG